MQVSESLKFTGDVKIVLTGPDGKVKEERHLKNLVVTTGKQWVAGRIHPTEDPADMSHMAVGTGTTAAVVGDTTLETELNRQALSGTVRSGAGTTYSATFGAGQGTGALTEAGILNAGAGGTLLSRVVFSVINKAAGDSMTIDWTINAT